MATKTAAQASTAHAGLAPAERRALHDAITSSALEGWTADADAIALLAEFTAGNITIDEYRARVLAKATSPESA